MAFLKLTPAGRQTGSTHIMPRLDSESDTRSTRTRKVQLQRIKIKYVIIRLVELSRTWESFTVLIHADVADTVR